MAARVIHFGLDECYRLNVLRRAGYEINECRNLIQFRTALESTFDTDAVMVNGSVSKQVISLARLRSPVPIVVFPGAKRTISVQDADLVVPSFTPPEKWLLDLANLIVRSRAIRAYSQLLQKQSSELGCESAVIRAQSRGEGERSMDLRRPKHRGMKNRESDRQ